MISEKKSELVVYDGYTGPRRFTVSFPKRKALLVAAPDEASAIAAAGQHWKQRWQRYEFYTGCTVAKAADGRNA